MTLEEYLRQNSWPLKKSIDHILRVEIGAGGVYFYIHPHGEGGDTENFKVEGNTLLPDPRITKADGHTFLDGAGLRDRHTEP